MANRADRDRRNPKNVQDVSVRKGEWDPIHVNHQGQRFTKHRINRPDTRLYPTQSLHRQIILATREPSTQDIITSAEWAQMEESIQRLKRYLGTGSFGMKTSQVQFFNTCSVAPVHPRRLSAEFRLRLHRHR